MLRVLWFSNTPASGIERIQKSSGIRSTGGWLYALNKAIEDNVELHVAFNHPYRLSTFLHGKTTFHPIYTGNILIQRVRERIGLLPYFGNLTQHYLQIISKVNPDIIHIHGTESAFLTVLSQTNIPSVVSIQGNLTVCAHKYCAGFHGLHLRAHAERISLRSLLIGYKTYHKSLCMLKLSSRIEAQHLVYARYIMGRTDWDRRITRILSPGSKYVTGHEMLRDGFYSEEWQQPDTPSMGKRIIFTTTGNSYYKGFETLCRSLSLLRAAGVSVEWRVAGIISDSLINQITRRELGADYPGEGLTLLGSLDEHQLVNQMKMADLYVMPSHIENSSNSLCEAMMLGMPCVATFAGGTGSLLTNDQDGVLIQDGDPWAMAGAIAELLSDPARAKHYGNAARRRAHERHDKELIVKHLIDTYTLIIKEQLT